MGILWQGSMDSDMHGAAHDGAGLSLAAVGDDSDWRRAGRDKGTAIPHYNPAASQTRGLMTTQSDNKRVAQCVRPLVPGSTLGTPPTRDKDVVIGFHLVGAIPTLAASGHE